MQSYFEDTDEENEDRLHSTICRGQNGEKNDSGMQCQSAKNLAGLE